MTDLMEIGSRWFVYKVTFHVRLGGNWASPEAQTTEFASPF